MAEHSCPSEVALLRGGRLQRGRNRGPVQASLLDASMQHLPGRSHGARVAHRVLDLPPSRVRRLRPGAVQLAGLTVAMPPEPGGGASTGTFSGILWRDANQAAIDGVRSIVEQHGWSDRVVWYP